MTTRQPHKHEWRIAGRKHHVCAVCGKRVLSSTLAALLRAQAMQRVLSIPR